MLIVLFNFRAYIILYYYSWITGHMIFCARSNRLHVDGRFLLGFKCKLLKIAVSLLNITIAEKRHQSSVPKWFKIRTIASLH